MLDEQQVPPHLYSLNGERLGTPYILEIEPIWRTYYLDERGGRSKDFFHGTEDSACTHFYHWVLSSELQEVSVGYAPRRKPVQDLDHKSVFDLMHMNGVDSTLCAMGEPTRSGQFVLGKDLESWYVYYYYEGERNLLIRFHSEGEAASYLLHAAIAASAP
ncbi:MAG: hypothetical protein ACRDWT_01080 [Jatrophihabitantaceae bacterium]